MTQTDQNLFSGLRSVRPFAPFAGTGHIKEYLALEHTRTKLLYEPGSNGAKAVIIPIQTATTNLQI